MIRRALPWLLAFVSTWAAAIGGNSVVTPYGPAVQYTTANSARIVYGGTATNTLSLARTYGLEGGGALVTDSVAVRAGAQAAEVAATRAVTQAAVAAGALRMLTGPVGAITITAAPFLYAWYQDSRVRPGNSPPSIEGIIGLQYQSSGGWYSPVGGPSGGWYNAPETACQTWLAEYNAVFQGGPYTSEFSQVNAARYSCAVLGANGQVANSTNIDYYDGSKCYDEFGRYTGINPTAGQCPDGQWQSISEQQALQRLVEKNSPGRSRGALPELVDRGIPVDAGPTSLSGPSQGSPSTVTQSGPGGQTTTTINNYYHYDGDTMTWNNTSTQTTTPPGGEPGSPTTTTTDGPDTQDERTDCEKDPSTVGCMKPGELPTDAPQWQSHSVEFHVDELGLPSGCPANRDIGINSVTLGVHVNMLVNYAPLCDNAAAIKAALIVMTAVACASYIVAVVGAR